MGGVSGIYGATDSFRDVKEERDSTGNEGRARNILIDSTGAFVGGVIDIGFAGKDLATTNEKCNDVESGVGTECSVSAATSGALHEYIKEMDEMWGMGLEGMESNNYTAEDKVDFAKQLNSEFATMGAGFWTSYITDATETYKPYLTGYDSNVNAAAQRYVDLVTEAAAYGSDYTAQGTRFATGYLQLAVDQAQLQAQSMSMDALDEVYGFTDEMECVPGPTAPHTPPPPNTAGLHKSTRSGATTPSSRANSSSK